MVGKKELEIINLCGEKYISSTAAAAGHMSRNHT